MAFSIFLLSIRPADDETTIKILHTLDWYDWRMTKRLNNPYPLSAQKVAV